MKDLKLRTRAAALVASLAAAAGGGLAAAQPAAAWAWDSHVHVAGSASCGSGFTTYGASLVQLWDDQGHYAQGTPNWLRNYGADFWSYPSGGGHIVSAKISCNGLFGSYSYWRSVGISRPAFGTQVNVNFNG